MPDAPDQKEIDHERVLTLKEATRGQNPETYIHVRVKDLDFLTNAVLNASPPPKDPPPKPEIDGGFTKEAPKVNKQNEDSNVDGT